MIARAIRYWPVLLVLGFSGAEGAYGAATGGPIDTCCVLVGLAIVGMVVVLTQERRAARGGEEA